MKEIRILVDDENLETVMSVVDSLSDELVDDINVIDKHKTPRNDKPSSTNVRRNSENVESIDEKREKLFSFATATILFLSIAAIYFEVYDQTYVPPFLRVILAAYWLYSLAGIMVAREGSDYWVSKLYFNVSK